MLFNVSEVSSARLPVLIESNSIRTIQLHHCNKTQSNFLKKGGGVLCCNANVQPEHHPTRVMFGSYTFHCYFSKIERKKVIPIMAVSNYQTVLLLFVSLFYTNAVFYLQILLNHL